MKWRSAWRHLLLSVLFISPSFPSSLSTYSCDCFLSLIAVVGLINVVGLLIGAWWHGEVEIDEVSLGGFRWGFFVVVMAYVWVCGNRRGKGE